MTRQAAAPRPPLAVQATVSESPVRATCTRASSVRSEEVPAQDEENHQGESFSLDTAMRPAQSGSGEEARWPQRVRSDGPRGSPGSRGGYRAGASGFATISPGRRSARADGGGCLMAGNKAVAYMGP